MMMIMVIIIIAVLFLFCDRLSISLFNRNYLSKIRYKELIHSVSDNICTNIHATAYTEVNEQVLSTVQ